MHVGPKKKRMLMSEETKFVGQVFISNKSAAGGKRFLVLINSGLELSSFHICLTGNLVTVCARERRFFFLFFSPNINFIFLK